MGVRGEKVGRKTAKGTVWLSMHRTGKETEGLPTMLMRDSVPAPYCNLREGEVKHGRPGLETYVDGGKAGCRRGEQVERLRVSIPGRLSALTRKTLEGIALALGEHVGDTVGGRRRGWSVLSSGWVGRWWVKQTGWACWTSQGWSHTGQRRWGLHTAARWAR